MVVPDCMARAEARDYILVVQVGVGGGDVVAPFRLAVGVVGGEKRHEGPPNRQRLGGGG